MWSDRPDQGWNVLGAFIGMALIFALAILS